MNATHRHLMVVRAIAAAAALAVAAQGGGVPMCMSLLAEAAAPCGMHTHRAATTHTVRVAALSPAPSGHGACHEDAASLGCAAGGGCPSGGPIAPAAVAPAGALPSALHVTPLGLAPTLLSYLAPPLSPPPQA